MMGWYPPLNDLSDLTWHMFTHVVETNQHSLHDIYVHGGLYHEHKYHEGYVYFFNYMCEHVPSRVTRIIQRRIPPHYTTSQPF